MGEKGKDLGFAARVETRFAGTTRGRRESLKAPLPPRKMKSENWPSVKVMAVRGKGKEEHRVIVWKSPFLGGHFFLLHEGQGGEKRGGWGGGGGGEGGGGGASLMKGNKAWGSLPLGGEKTHREKDLTV